MEIVGYLIELRLVWASSADWTSTCLTESDNITFTFCCQTLKKPFAIYPPLFVLCIIMDSF